MKVVKPTTGAVASISICVIALVVAGWGYLARHSGSPDGHSYPLGPRLPEVVNADAEIVTSGAIVANETTMQARKRVRFPDGEQFFIEFKPPFPAVPPEYKPDNLAHGYDALATKARNGDALAATALHRLLFDCRAMYYQTEEQLEQLRIDISTTRSYKSLDPVSGDVVIETADAEGIALRVLERSFDICRWVTQEMKDEAEEWQALAAMLGNPRQIKGFVLGTIGNTEKGRNMLREAFSSGYYDAGTTLGRFLIGDKYPIINENEFEPIDAPRMRIEGFAYYYLAVAIAHADDSLTPRAKEYIHRDFNLAVQSLSNYEQAEGVELAKRILSSHDNCCQSAGPLN